MLRGTSKQVRELCQPAAGIYIDDCMTVSLTHGQGQACLLHSSPKTEPVHLHLMRDCSCCLLSNTERYFSFFEAALFEDSLALHQESD